MSGHSEIQLRFPISNANEKTSFPFVEWANGEDSDYPEGQHVEAVFCGHTHENHIFYDVETDGMDSPYELLKPYNKNGISAYTTATIYFANTVPQPSDGICGAPVYIETTTATKNW